MFHADDTVPRSYAADGGRCVDSAQFSWTALSTRQNSAAKQSAYTMHQSAVERLICKIRALATLCSLLCVALCVPFKKRMARELFHHRAS